MDKTLRLGVLLSGGGRTLENLLAHVEQPPSAVPASRPGATGPQKIPPASRPGAAGPQKIPAEVVLVIASRPGIRGIDIGRAAGIPTHLVRRADYPTVEAFSDAMIRLLDEARVDLVCMAGFLSHWIVPDRYRGRVMNIHPALLPSFGGKGMYGHRVHEAVVARGCKVSGCTVHFVNNTYDEGPIILQRPVPVYAEDAPDDLAARVFREECLAYPEAIRLFAEGRLRIDGQVVRINDPQYRRP
jgi:formyltetrahydrofolate-dependent phosphoribosylglycinamide formyltransferase